jgi:hypothetical protein
MQVTLEQYTSVQRWFRQLRKKASAIENGGIPPDTYKLALASLSAFTKFVNMTPDQLIDDAYAEMRTKGHSQKHCDLLDKFWEDYPTKTTAKVYYAYLKGFYKRNGVTITTATPTAPTMRTGDLKLTSEFVRRICDVAPLQHASWILANNYMGLRIGAVTEMTIADFQTEQWQEDRPLYPVRIRKHISGTFEYTVFIGHDAKTVLQSHFAKEELKSQDKPWDYDEGYLTAFFKKYAFQAGVIDAPFGLWDESAWLAGTPKGPCKLRTHAQRKHLQTTLEQTVPLNWVDLMLGHVPRGAQGKAYSQPTDEQLYSAYLTALPELEIYGHHTMSPALPKIQIQKETVLAQLKSMGYSDERIEHIRNELQKVRTQAEVNSIIQNLMVYAK